MSAHTPAPWDQRATLIVRYGENGGVICEMSELRAEGFITHQRLALGSKDFDEQMANARLIAAAPDLLDACREVEAVLGPEPAAFLRRTMASVRAAIAKATEEAGQ